MTESLPDPLVPAEVDLRGYEFMPYYGDRLRDSDLNSRATDAEYRAAHNLWWSAWKQVPAASLPDDDVILARLADLGRDVKTWRKVRDGALRGFVKCSNGRLYHRILGPLAIEAWQFRNSQRDRTEAARKARLSKNLLQTGDVGKKRSVTESTGQDRTGQDIKSNSATAPPVDNLPTLRGAMCAVLRAEGVPITPSNPLLVQWVEHGVTVNQAREAVDIARERKPKPEKIPPAYLDPIIAEIVGAGRSSKSKVNGAPPGEWWQSIDGITAKAMEVGVEVRTDDPGGLMTKCAIAAKIGLGPWLDQRNFTEMRIYEQMRQKQVTT